MMSPSLLFEIFVNATIIGSIYALFAFGLALIFGVLGFANFSHGEFYMLGALGTAMLVNILSIPYWAAVPVVILGGIAAGTALYDLLLKRLKQGDFQKSILITVGLALVIQNGALFAWGPTPRFLTTSFSVDVVELGGLIVPITRLVALGMAVAAFAVVYLGLNYTRTGLALRGVAQNRDAALMVGIPPRTVSRIAVASGLGMCALSGAVFALFYTIYPAMGLLLVFKAFAIVVIGGLGSIMGAVIVSFGVGLLESTLGLYYGAAAANTLIFLTMIVFLLSRPHGLLGRRVRI